MQHHWPVIIVGAGPTGLTIANLLARYGVEALLVERNPDTVQEPRAVSIDDESLRTMQSVGVINDLVPSIVLGYGSEYLSPGKRRFLKVKPTSSDYGYPKRNAFRQPELEALLRRHLVKSDRAMLRFETTLNGFTQSDDMVRVSVTANGEASELTCDYLIAADGSRSFVRQQLGIQLQGSTFKERWLIIDLENTSDLSRDTKVYCDPARPCLSLPGPRGTRRFEFMLHDGEDEEQALDPGNISSLMAAHGEGATTILKRKVVYTFHARMAERWSQGRVFLAGDAAHLMPPFAGQGMNSGVRDAHNLAWKMAAVAKGELGAELLASYEVERRAHVAQMIDLAVQMGRVMMPKTLPRAYAVQSFFRLLALYPPARSYFAEMKYKPKPRFNDGFLLKPMGGPGAVGLVGALFPQAMVMTTDGYKLLDDELGDGFALVAPPGTPVGHLAGLDALPLPCRRVAVLDREDASLQPDGVIAVRDIKGELAVRLDGRPPGLYLVRPDRYVAAFFGLESISSLRRDVEQLCSRTRL